jgi:hypothetical protein
MSVFLPFICRLRFFEIDVEVGPLTAYDYDILSFLTGSLCLSLTSAATLEHLKFNISFHGNTSDIDCDTFYEYLRDASFWTHLDSITTHPTGSRLQRVDISIDYCNLRVLGFDEDEDEPDDLEPDEHDVLNAVLDSLPLLRSKVILFVEVHSIHSCATYVPGTTSSAGFCDVLPGTG